MKTSRKNALVLTADVLLANLAVIFCMALRYLEEPEKVCAHFFSYLIGVPILSIFLIVVYRVFGVYRIIWKYARVKDAFKVVNKNLVKDKTLVIIDDVSTTGATAQAIAEKLKNAGAKKVYLISVASTPPIDKY